MSSTLSAYERERAKNIAANRARLAELGLEPPAAAAAAAGGRRRRVDVRVRAPGTVAEAHPSEIAPPLGWARPKLLWKNVARALTAGVGAGEHVSEVSQWTNADIDEALQLHGGLRIPDATAADYDAVRSARIEVGGGASAAVAPGPRRASRRLRGDLAGPAAELPQDSEQPPSPARKRRAPAAAGRNKRARSYAERARACAGSFHFGPRAACGIGVPWAARCSPPRLR